jgi:hypothetical protein
MHALRAVKEAENGRLAGGGGGIRTHERLAPLPIFKTGAFNRSATPPKSLNLLEFLPFLQSQFGSVCDRRLSLLLVTGLGLCRRERAFGHQQHGLCSELRRARWTAVRALGRKLDD